MHLCVDSSPLNHMNSFSQHSRVLMMMMMMKPGGLPQNRGHRTGFPQSHVHVVVFPVPGLLLDQSHKLMLLQAAAAFLSPGRQDPLQLGHAEP